MRAKFSAAIIGTVVILALLFAINSQQAAANFGMSQPTPAPTPTPGEAVISWVPTSVPLGEPRTTQEQALELALDYDGIAAVWDHPWTLDTLRSEPGRITVELFQSRTEESANAGRNEWFAPEVEVDAGAVWRITIKGDVQVGVFSMSADDVNAKYDGVTYVFSQRTGNLLTVITGPKK